MDCYVGILQVQPEALLRRRSRHAGVRAYRSASLRRNVALAVQPDPSNGHRSCRIPVMVGHLLDTGWRRRRWAPRPRATRSSRIRESTSATVATAGARSSPAVARGRRPFPPSVREGPDIAGRSANRSPHRRTTRLRQLGGAPAASRCTASPDPARARRRHASSSSSPLPGVGRTSRAAAAPIR